MTRANKRPRTAKSEQVRGTISIHPNGYGFFQPETTGSEEIFIPPSKMGAAMPGDRVLVRLKPGRPRSGHREGAVVKILERARSELVGFFNGSFVVPRDERIRNWFHVPCSRAAGAVAGDLVRASIVSYPGTSGQAEAEIIEVLGRELNPLLESRLILHQYGFCEDFSGRVSRELAEVPEEVISRDAKNRVDLTHLPLVTIDPVDAKDFDDAVCAKKFDWGFRLWVAIADVSHYVRSGSALDLQAFKSATSVYFPDRAVPMLPEKISAGIASLKPGQFRLAMAAEIDYDPEGRPQRSRFYPAVIRSCFRMNYQEVQALCDRADPELEARYSSLLSTLEEMASLARILHRNRVQRGAIDLDLPEPHIELDEKGEPTDIFAYPRLFSHRLVEEFMLQANQAVAEFLSRKKMAFPFRIHEPPPPDKIQELDQFLQSLGLPLLARDRGPHQVKPRDFQRLMQRAAETPLSELVSYLSLRAMTQARYSPENKGHFGLAIDHYCHFTSPIRRYPDLIVHRILKQALGFEKPDGTPAPQGLAEACEHCSERERAAADAEREMAKVYQARLMSRRLGQEFSGKISGFIDAGVFVQIDRPMAEGLVPASQLSGYECEPKLHTAFTCSPRMELHLGDQVSVAVDSVNLERREINLRLLALLKSAFTRPAKSLMPAPRKKQRPQKSKKSRHGRRGS